ncbi:MAG: hypothetical protein AB7P02_22370 [Alphaproteobacteria bacterium]
MVAGIGPAPAQGRSEPRLFVCEIRTAQELAADGGFEATPYTRLLLEPGVRLTFDERSGRLGRELPTGPLATRRFLVVQRGGERTDLVARQISSPSSPPHDVLRIVVTNPAMPFLYLDGDAVITGSCIAE